MPTYEYRCADCGEHLEVVQSFTDEALTECPACRGRLRKVFGSIGITFKGSGFYKTDSRSANGSKPSSKDGAAADGASESKPKDASKESSDTASSTDKPASNGDSSASSKGPSKDTSKPAGAARTA